MLFTERLNFKKNHRQKLNKYLRTSHNIWVPFLRVDMSSYQITYLSCTPNFFKKFNTVIKKVCKLNFSKFVVKPKHVSLNWLEKNALWTIRQRRCWMVMCSVMSVCQSVRSLAGPMWPLLTCSKLFTFEALCPRPYLLPVPRRRVHIISLGTPPTHTQTWKARIWRSTNRPSYFYWYRIWKKRSCKHFQQR